ncbi:YbaB/EbfC family nucleoid-associated protein [Actinoplanes sp. HUAS TT8]|uniref:YbaB/EbfC family nucleoid-associated protein n=1 Tax=Actinoplanes sp. HUAS TT8 TaxID=3447453 RepID=UPI003F52204E
MGALRRLQEEADRLVGQAASADGRVTVTVTGSGEIEVRLGESALRDISANALAATISRTAGDAMWDLHTQYRQTSQRILGRL